MASTAQHEDENYEKPSRHKMWHERSGKPIATRAMMKSEIEDYRKVLVNSYQCDNSDITFDFQKITDENDEDRDDCIWLKYKMRCMIDGKPSAREIFNIKLPIPDEIRKMAETLRRQQTDYTHHTRRSRAAIGYVSKVTEVSDVHPTPTIIPPPGDAARHIGPQPQDSEQQVGGQEPQRAPAVQPTVRARLCRPTRSKPKV